MSRIQEVEDLRRLFPNHNMSFTPDGSQGLRLECTGRVLSIAAVVEFSKTAKAKLKNDEAVAFFQRLTPEQRICDGCREAEKEPQCKLGPKGTRCTVCHRRGQVCSFTNRLRMDILCQRHRLSLPEAVELYRPFACGENNLDGNSRNDDAVEQAPSRPNQLPSTYQTTSRATSTRFRPRASLASKGAYTRFRDIEEDEPQPSSLKKQISSASRVTRPVNIGGKRQRSISPAASRRRPRLDSPNDSSDIEISSPHIPPASSSKRDQLDALKREIKAWKEKTSTAQDEAQSMRDLAVHYERRCDVLKEKLAEEKEDHLVQQERLATVQELVRSSAELEPNGIALPTLAVWVMSESASLTFLHRSLSSASIPESPSEPVLLSREDHSRSLALIASQYEGLNNWLVGHLPGFQHLVISTAQEGVVAPSEARYKSIEDAARVAREELALKRVIEENRIAAEEEERQKEIEKKKARQDALCAKLAETREAARMAKEAQDKLQAELLDLEVEMPHSQQHVTEGSMDLPRDPEESVTVYNPRRAI